MEKRVVLFAVALCLLLIIPLSSALTASIDKPKMVLYYNMTQGQTLEFEQSVIVNNDNDFEVDIEISPDSDWKDYIQVTNPNFKLQPDETKEVFYTVTLDEIKDYSGDILITFRYEPDKSQVSLAQRLIVQVTEIEPETAPITGSVIGTNTKAMLVSAVVLIILLIILIAIVNIKQNKK